MIKPATPGTFVVLVGTILLVLATVTTPVTQGLYLFEASISTTVSTVSINETMKLGVLGYCVGSTCSNTTIGYTIDLQELLGISSTLGTEINDLIGNSVTKWLTYVLVLVPVSAGLGLISFILGLTAHIREFGGTCLTTSFASLAGTVATIAFIFEMIVFTIAKKRIESSSVGGSASYGNGCWLTLIGALCLTFSSCFFCCGRRIIKTRDPLRDASNRRKGEPDPEYGHAMRSSAIQQSQDNNSYGAGRPKYNYHSESSNKLPAFAEINGGEVVPLASLDAQHDDDDYNSQHQHARQYSGSAAGTQLTGVGMGYGRRDDGRGVPVSIAPGSDYAQPEYQGGYTASPYGAQQPTSPTAYGHPVYAQQQQQSYDDGYNTVQYNSAPYDPPTSATSHSRYATPPPQAGQLPLPTRSPSPINSGSHYTQPAPSYATHQDPYAYQAQHQPSYPPQNQYNGY